MLKPGKVPTRGAKRGQQESKAKQVRKPEEFMVLRTQVFTTYTQSYLSQYVVTLR